MATQAERIADAPCCEDLPGNRLAVTLIIDDPWATAAKNWAEQAGKDPAVWLSEQINHLFYQEAFPAV